MDPEDYQWQAVQAVKEAAQLTDFPYRGDKDLGRTWAMTFSKSRDSSILEEANYDAVKGDLEKRFPRDVSDERFSHFAVGWLDQLLVRMLDKKGKVTKAGIAALEWKDKLESYPVADEEDYSRREFEATLENIKYEGGLDETTAQSVYDWFRENDEMALENVDDKGGYPSKEKIDKALKSLGVLGPEEGDEPEKVVYVDPPEQLRFWPKP